MSTQTLRGLAKGYAKGSIGKEEYRKSRAILVKGIVEGNIVLKTIDYEPLLKPDNDIKDAITEGISGDKTEIISPQQKAKPVSNNVLPAIKQNVSTNSCFFFILISSIIVLSLIVAVILFYPDPPGSTTIAAAVSSDNSMASPGSTIAAKKSSDAAGIMIADFLSEKNWNEDSLARFIGSWTSLSPEERESANETKRMKRMQDSIYKQFLEGKALSSIDSEKAIMKQQMLIEFANSIGINDSQLNLQ